MLKVVETFFKINVKFYRSVLYIALFIILLFVIYHLYVSFL